MPASKLSLPHKHQNTLIKEGGPAWGRPLSFVAVGVGRELVEVVVAVSTGQRLFACSGADFGSRSLPVEGKLGLGGERGYQWGSHRGQGKKIHAENEEGRNGNNKLSKTENRGRVLLLS